MIVRVCTNCLELDERNMTIDELESGGGLFDGRHKVYSTNNTLDLEEYYNYISLCKSIAFEQKDVRNNHLLKLGYIPICMPPTFMTGLYEVIRPKLTIPYIERQVISFNNFSFIGEGYDIWAHKFDCAEVMGCQPIEVTVKKFLKSIM